MNTASYKSPTFLRTNMLFYALICFLSFSVSHVIVTCNDVILVRLKLTIIIILAHSPSSRSQMRLPSRCRRLHHCYWVRVFLLGVHHSASVLVRTDRPKRCRVSGSRRRDQNSPSTKKA
jgi:hypothetical protein